MIIVAKKLITGDGTTVLPEYGIKVDAGRITSLAPWRQLIDKYPNDTVENYDGCTLIPGYIDTHTHLGCYDGMWDVAQYNGYRKGILGLQQTQECFKWGVTTVRDAGCPDMLLETLRRMQTYGYVTLPRILHCNQAIAMTGGHCWVMDIVTEADGIEGLRTAIRKQIRSGADWIKLMTTHRENTTVEYSQEELNFAVAESHRLGKKCFIHAGLQPGLQMAIDAKPDSIEHGTRLTVDQAKQMRDEGIYWCPTICSLEFIVPRFKASADSSNPYYQIQIKDAEYYEKNAGIIRKNFMELAQTGVKIVAGTDFDTGYWPSAPIGMELRYMAEFGYDPLLAIKSASTTAAEMLELSDVGLLAEGYTADITVLGGDPQIDRNAFEDVRATYSGGELVYKK